jgi:hypothetical protein
MAPRQPSAKSDETDQPKLPETVSEQITYLPGPEDANSTTWMRHVFHAHQPKTVTNPELIEKARNNPWFKVGHFDVQTDARTKIEPTPFPKTAGQYKVYALDWSKKSESVDALDMRWAEEEKLRRECDVDEEDIDYLRSVIGPLRSELAKKDRPT